MRISLYILREHIGPFISALAILTFVLFMDKLFDLLDLIIGKGLPGSVVAEIFMLSLPYILAMTVPMAVLVATLMAFGRLSQDNEVTALKASGVNLYRMVLPSFLMSGLIAISLVYFNNTILPESNHKLKNLLIDIHRKRPALKLVEGLFIEEFEGYSIYVRHLDPLTSKMRDVTIYELPDQPRRSPRKIEAKRGELSFENNETVLVLTLEDGELQEVDPKDPSRFHRLDFEKHQLIIPGVGDELERQQRSYRGDREMSVDHMRERIQTYREEQQNALEKMITTLEDEWRYTMHDLAKGFPTSTYLQRYIITPDTNRTRNRQQIDPFLRLKPVDRKNQSMQRFQQQSWLYDSKQKQINRYQVEIEKKYAIPFACVVFVLVGAPLGIVARRGGVGVGFSVSLGFFILYYMFLIGGERMADRGLASPFWAMWGANILIGIAGIYLCIQNVRETKAIDWGWLQIFNVFRWFRRQSHIPTAGESYATIEIQSVRLKWVRLLDLHVAWNFLVAFAFCLISFIVIFLVVDFFERVHRYVSNEVPAEIVALYYLLKIPWILTIVIPIGVLLACIFGIGGLAKHREIMVMKAAGISLTRLLLPVFFIGLLISFGVMALNELVVPHTMRQMNYIENKQIRKRETSSERIRQNVFHRGEGDRMYYARRYDPKIQTLSDVLLTYPLNDTLMMRIDAKQAVYQDSSWVFKKGYVRLFNTAAHVEEAYHFHEVRMTYLTEIPTDFANKALQPDEMNYVQLGQYIERIRAGGEDVTKWLVRWHFKLAFPFVSFIIVLFGAPLSSATARGGNALGFGISIFVSFIYWGFVQVGRSMGETGALDPLFAAWMGNLFFGVAALITLWKAEQSA
ncbi:MAG: YjgP/YjgQ family permease [Gemmatimonadetes bacterium]|nr:MAG: YjgP/YjgQ family permease [Gemmatimonadota bacterium]